MLRLHRPTFAALLVGLGCRGEADAPATATRPQRPGPVAGAAGSRSTATTPGGTAPAATIPTGPGVLADGTIVSAVSWHEGSLDQALARAGRDRKLVFADVGAYWCPPCRDLDEKVFTDPDVGEFLARGYVAVRIDAEKDEGPELVDRYHVQAYPTVLVLEPSGVERGRLVDYHAPAELVAALERIARGENVLAELEAAVATEPDDVEARFELAHAYALAARREPAEPLYDDVLVADPKNNLGLASKVLYDRAMFFTHKLDRRLDEAIAAYRELQRRFPESKEAVRAFRQIGRLHCALGRPDDAIASLDAMIARDPSSVELKASYGWFCFREKCRPAAGLAVVEAGLAQDPENAGLHYLRAELSHLAGDDVAALAAVRRASAIEPRTAYYRRQVRRFEALGHGRD
jgi:tetratricopeptide (TPR) repeat protein